MPVFDKILLEFVRKGWKSRVSLRSVTNKPPFLGRHLFRDPSFSLYSLSSHVRFFFILSD